MFLILGFGAMFWLIPWLLLVRGASGTRKGPCARRRRTGFLLGCSEDSGDGGILFGSFAYQYFVYFCMTWMPPIMSNAGMCR